MIKKTTLLSSFAIVLSMGTMSAQSYEWVSSTENNTWQQSKVKLQTNTGRTPLLEVNGSRMELSSRPVGRALMNLDGMHSTCFHGSNRKLFFNSCLLPEEI